MEWSFGEFIISTDEKRLQIDAIRKFLVEESYWAANRTSEQMQKAVDNSLCFGLYAADKQIGFARVVSDFATFAYLGDVFILKEFRGRGLSKWLMETIISHPDLQGLRRWLLATRDAHGLYWTFACDPLRFPARGRERTAPDAKKKISCFTQSFLGYNICTNFWLPPLVPKFYSPRSITFIFSNYMHDANRRP